MVNRRHVIAGVSSFALAAQGIGVSAQIATPAATPVQRSAPGTEEVLPAWLEAQAELQHKGEAVSTAFWNRDIETIMEYGTPELQSVIADGAAIEEAISMYSENQVQLAIPELGALFFGQYTPELLSGVFLQGGVLAWYATPAEAQAKEVPNGIWNGVIGEGIVDLEIILEFTGTADSLEATLSIPSQMMMNYPLSNVAYTQEIPIGEMIDSRSLPAGGSITPINDYSELYTWGENTLLLNTFWNESGELASFSLYPQAALPEVQTPDSITARLPFDGAWIVFWGGETEFRNYHAVNAQQRHALDIMIWRDGSTAQAPGIETTDYHTFGQPYLAPIDGTVVAVEDGNEDIQPQTPGIPGTNPAGNHIVIESDGVFVFLAHCANGSILVQEGDTVSAGDVVAAVGNSGNTSEPHVHIHAQTSPYLFDPAAVGVPIVFENSMENGEQVEQLSARQGTVVEQRA